MFGWWKERRRRKLRTAPFPEAWLAHLEANVRHYGHLPPAQRARLREDLLVFVPEKTWVGCGGLEITDEIRVTVAGQACLLLLGADEHHYFDAVKSILVYPDAFRGQAADDDAYDGPTFGEAWSRGPVVLSWRHVRHGGEDPADGLNVVLHEFAHQLDALSGDLEGTPPLPHDALQRWRDVAERAYLRLVDQTEQGAVTLLDQYGATNRAEFFAVATECFFERPGAMSRQHPDLYDLFSEFYRLDPRAWFPEDATSSPVTAGHTPLEDQAAAPAETLPLSEDEADAAFSRGLFHLSQDDFADAIAAFEASLRLRPGDAEAWGHCAEARFELDDDRRALEDAERALAIDPVQPDALRIRGYAHHEQGDHERAIADLTRLLEVRPHDAEALHWRGAARARKGDLPGALKDLDASIRLKPQAAEAWLDRARVREALGDGSGAAEDRATAHGIDPDLREDGDDPTSR